MFTLSLFDYESTLGAKLRRMVIIKVGLWM